MARDTITVQAKGNEGSQSTPELSYTDAVLANGLQFDNLSYPTFVVIKNGGAASQTATFIGVADQALGRSINMAVAVGAGKERIVGPFLGHAWNQSDGTIQIDVSGEDNFQFAAFH